MARASRRARRQIIIVIVDGRWLGMYQLAAAVRRAGCRAVRILTVRIGAGGSYADCLQRGLSTFPWPAKEAGWEGEAGHHLGLLLRSSLPYMRWLGHAIEAVNLGRPLSDELRASGTRPAG